MLDMWNQNTALVFTQFLTDMSFKKFSSPNIPSNLTDTIFSLTFSTSPKQIQKDVNTNTVSEYNVQFIVL